MHYQLGCNLHLCPLNLKSFPNRREQFEPLQTKDYQPLIYASDPLKLGVTQEEQWEGTGLATPRWYLS